MKFIKLITAIEKKIYKLFVEFQFKHIDFPVSNVFFYLPKIQHINSSLIIFTIKKDFNLCNVPMDIDI